ncbi:MAG: glycosyltransferase family 4 protein [Vicingaceae bacterium]
MKVTFINRSLTFGGFSFETLFKTIKSNLKEVNYTDFYDKTHNGFLKNIKELKKIPTDVYHITGGLGYYALFLPTKKTILTVHDTNHYEHDLKGIKKWVFGLLFYQLPIKNVKYVTVVSHHTKKRLIALFNVPEEKIKVITNCYPNNFNKRLKTELSSPVNILQIGTKKNKNINRLIEAIKGLDISLTIIGKLDPSTKNNLINSKLKYHNKVNLSNNEIYTEYCNCDIVSFVSLNEGFGLPIIEANAVGRVILTSNISSMPEVAGNAAHLVDPYSTEAIKAGFIKLIEDTPYRQSLLENGFENIKRFEPEKIAQDYNNLYKMLLLNE